MSDSCAIDDGDFDSDADYVLPAYKKMEFVPAIHNSTSQLDIPLRDSYFYTAKSTVERLIEASNEIEGFAALYLFRHYLELTVKRLVHNARYLKSKSENVKGDVRKPDGDHNIEKAWIELKDQFPKKAGGGVIRGVDYSFAEQCIGEFHLLDPTSEFLRYKNEKGSKESRLDGCVRVDWSTLLHNMQHTHDVLEQMDSYLIETYGLNEDWEAEQASW